MDTLPTHEEWLTQANDRLRRFKRQRTWLLIWHFAGVILMLGLSYLAWELGSRELSNQISSLAAAYGFVCVFFMLVLGEVQLRKIRKDGKEYLEAVRKSHAI